MVLGMVTLVGKSDQGDLKTIVSTLWRSLSGEH